MRNSFHQRKMRFVFSQEELNWDLKGIPRSAGGVGLLHGNEGNSELKYHEILRIKSYFSSGLSQGYYPYSSKFTG